MKRFISALVLTMVLAAACGNPLVEPTATPTSTATATSIPTATSTAIPAATASPTATQPAPAATATSTQPAATATQTSIPAATASPTTAPATAVPASATPIPTNTPTGGGSGSGTGAPAQACTFATPGDLDSMPKTVIELFQQGTWTHRVFNPRLFKAPSWDGADSWFVTLNVGPNSGGSWTSFGNPGQVVYRANSTSVSWCLGVFTTSKWKSQFLAGANDVPVAVNVRITPNTPVTVVTNSGQVKTQNTSDGGDITIIVPDQGQISISVGFSTAAPTFESMIWWGPYDRSANINTLDAR